MFRRQALIQKCIPLVLVTCARHLLFHCFHFTASPSPSTRRQKPSVRPCFVDPLFGCYNNVSALFLRWQQAKQGLSTAWRASCLCDRWGWGASIDGVRCGGFPIDGVRVGSEGLSMCLTFPEHLVTPTLGTPSRGWRVGRWGGDYSTQSWVSTVKLIEKEEAVDLHTEGAVTFP